MDINRDLFGLSLELSVRLGRTIASDDLDVAGGGGKKDVVVVVGNGMEEYVLTSEYTIRLSIQVSPSLPFFSFWAGCV